jgi:3-deoxy-D-manno-octulosonic-acid transferase
MTAKTPEKRRVSRAAGRALARYTDFVVGTSRTALDPPDAYDVLARAEPAILAIWHGQFLLMPAMQGPKRAHIMVARHGDGEIIAEVLRHYGSELIRGAGAGSRRKDRGGAHALRAALRTLESGISVAMTADVPPGPARRAGIGIVTLARMSGRPIVPMAVASSRFMTLDTWSRMTINLPFSRVGGAVGAPIHVARDAGPDDIEAARRAVEEGLDAVTARAYALAGADPDRATPPSVLARRDGPPPPGWRFGLYRALTRAASPALGLMLAYRRRRGKEDETRAPERRGIASVVRPAGPLAWLHAASVGETIALVPVIAKLREARPDVVVLLTTGTVTSARIAAERLGSGVIHQYIPLDAPQYVARFLDHWKPDLGVFMEGDVWPNLVLDADRRGVPLALINGRMSSRSFGRWRRNRGLARQLFGRFRVVLAQNEKLARRFGELGALDARVTGNLKIDSPPPPVDDSALSHLVSAVGTRPRWVAASTHPGEETIIAVAHKLVRAAKPDTLTVIVPRHPDRGAAIVDALSATGLSVRRRSTGELPDAQTDIYVADTLGELGTIYALAPIAFIGGSLVRHGGQNPIEAIRRGAVVLSGPETDNFADAYSVLRAAGGARLVRNADDLANEVIGLLKDDGEVVRMRQSGEHALEALAGALARTVDTLLDLLPPGEPPRGP